MVCKKYSIEEGRMCKREGRKEGRKGGRKFIV
jgi:hypothetical protein